ncbi:hypothetical protein OIU78_017403 [Salix suchowensis]|nr:hypothetical protein OIU78_017403 [Salix suchowensis]
MLRTAPPLRQDPSCYSSRSLRTDVEEGMTTASGFFMPRKTADALEELRSYREMKDLLLSKEWNSGGQQRSLTCSWQVHEIVPLSSGRLIVF